jgi:hypothetical protein
MSRRFIKVAGLFEGNSDTAHDVEFIHFSPANRFKSQPHEYANDGRINVDEMYRKWSDVVITISLNGFLGFTQGIFGLTHVTAAV